MIAPTNVTGLFSKKTQKIIADIDILAVSMSAKFFAQLSFKKARYPLVAATVVAAGAERTATVAAAVVTAETAVRAEEQKPEDYDPEALVVLE